MDVNLGVTASETAARSTYLCGAGDPPTVAFGVSNDRSGRFAYTEATGSIVVWKTAGHFVSPNSRACGGSKGSTNLTLE
jgi:hypothetical protein